MVKGFYWLSLKITKMSSEIQKRLLPLPEKPIQPSILKRHLWVFFPTPRTANERLVDITAKSLFFGFYAGVIRCWWLDYKKATTTPPRESIRFLRTVRNPKNNLTDFLERMGTLLCRLYNWNYIWFN